MELKITMMYPNVASIFLFTFLAPLSLSGQYKPSIEVESYQFNDADNVIELFVKAMDNGKSLKLSNKDIYFFEKYENGEDVPLAIYEIIPEEKEAETASETKDKFSVLFLSGLNREGFPNFNEQRNNLVTSFIENINLPNNTEYFMAAYGDVVYPPKPLKTFNLNIFENELSDYLKVNKNADFFKSLIEAVRFMESRRDSSVRQVIILLTDGTNFPNVEQYNNRNEIPYDTADLKYLLGNLGDEFMIFPLGIGQTADAGIFQLITNATSNKQDTFSTSGELPQQLEKMLFTKRDLLYNNIIRLEPNPQHRVYKGEKRLISIKGNYGETIFDMSGIGSPERPDTTLLDKDYASWHAWLLRFILGIAFVGLVLGAMVWLVPWNRKREFNRRYVVPYQEQSGVRKRDPLSGEVFQAGEMVVVKCPRVTSSIATWEYVGNQCPQYPRCLSFDPPCEGHGAPDAHDKFTSMKGIFRRLNWLWYGMVGGLLAWAVLAFINVFGYNGYYNVVQALFRQSLQKGGQLVQDLNRFIVNLSNELIIGTALGAGICLALSYIEEKSQPRRFSWVRVMVRTLAGIVVSLLVFLVGFYLQYNGIIDNRIMAGLLTWALFGLAVGAIMSVESSITLSRGLLGGLAASLAGYVVYLLLLENVFVDDYPLAKLISLITLGGIFGLILVTVITSLEDFELEYISPEAFRQTNPISKWLKKNIDVFIGTEQGSYVYIKWTDDQVKPRHARMHFEKGVVFLEAYAETLLNGRPMALKKSTPLKDGDILQLGRDSVSRMRFRERRKSHYSPPSSDKGTPRQKSQPQDSGDKIRIKYKDQ